MNGCWRGAACHKPSRFLRGGQTIKIAAAFIAVKAAVYHGTQLGQARSETDITGDVNATATTTSSTAVPYNVDYGIYTLTVETANGTGKWQVRHRFQQKGLYRRMYGIPVGKGHHPSRTVIEEAMKWIHKGGLTNPLEGVAPPQ
ncbi:MAG: hypothetical protein ACRD22_05140 [Terriglobia bacterium]